MCCVGHGIHDVDQTGSAISGHSQGSSPILIAEKRPSSLLVESELWASLKRSWQEAWPGQMTTQASTAALDRCRYLERRYKFQSSVLLRWVVTAALGLESLLTKVPATLFFLSPLPPANIIQTRTQTGHFIKAHYCGRSVDGTVSLSGLVNKQSGSTKL